MSGNCYDSFPSKLLTDLGVTPSNQSKIKTNTTKATSYYTANKPQKSLAEIIAEGRECVSTVISNANSEAQGEIQNFIIASVILIIVSSLVCLVVYSYIEYWPLYVFVAFAFLVSVILFMFSRLKLGFNRIANKARSDLETCLAKTKLELEKFESTETSALYGSLCAYAGATGNTSSCTFNFAIEFCGNLGGFSGCTTLLSQLSSSYHPPPVSALASSAETFATCAAPVVTERLQSSVLNVSYGLTLATIVSVIFSIFISYSFGFEYNGEYAAILLTIAYVATFLLMYYYLRYKEEQFNKNFSSKFKKCSTAFASHVQTFSNEQQESIEEAFCLGG